MGFGKRLSGSATYLLFPENLKKSKIPYVGTMRISIVRLQVQES